MGTFVFTGDVSFSVANSLFVTAQMCVGLEDDSALCLLKLSRWKASFPV